MVHYEHYNCHANALVGIIYKKDEGVWMGIHIHGESIGQAQFNLNMIVDQPELIHDESFMIGMMDPWATELTPFQD